MTVRALCRPERSSEAGNTPRHRPRRGWRRRIAIALLVIAALTVVAAVVLLTPSPSDSDVAAAVRADPDVTVTDHDGYLELAPADAADTDQGLIFYPAARARAESYLGSWAPIVESTGITVYLADVPFGFATLDEGAAGRIIDAEQDVSRRWIGGHSMGGITASRYAAAHPDTEFKGLVLWAAFPAEGVEADNVLAVSGGRDGIVPTKIVRERTAPTATLFEIEGMEHSQFGSYSSIFGDGDPTITDDDARRQLARVTEDFLLGTGS
ncbi:alpha/beta hydrolase [Arthrobacter sp. H5]|uniref:alpha/beta hydrolase n=1 Tax=Arthrobacter sp. H5 TaxID=1267973 RepID=UPI0004BCEBE0|nr:alpha/beta hydrolase [Arthrobacter sp. H5]